MSRRSTILPPSVLMSGPWWAEVPCPHGSRAGSPARVRCRRHAHPFPAVRGTFSPLRRRVRPALTPLPSRPDARLCGGHGTTGVPLHTEEQNMSRFMQGDSVQLMATFPDSSIDFILTDPPYLVGFRPVRALDRR